MCEYGVSPGLVIGIGTTVALLIRQWTHTRIERSTYVEMITLVSVDDESVQVEELVATEVEELDGAGILGDGATLELAEEDTLELLEAGVGLTELGIGIEELGTVVELTELRRGT